MIEVKKTKNIGFIKVGKLEHSILLAKSEELKNFTSLTKEILKNTDDKTGLIEKIQNA